MMIHAATQDTFLSCQELLQRYSRQCLHAEKALRQQDPEVSEPYQKVLERIAKHQHSIVQTLEDYTRRGPKAVLSTRIQYKQPTQPNQDVSSPGLAIQQATDINREIVAALTEQADKSTPLSIREALGALAEEIDTINRRISMDRVTATDL